MDIPVAYVGGVLSREHAAAAFEAGCEFIQVGRATVRDPDWVNKIGAEHG